MNNTPENNTFPTDSLGRRIGTALDFACSSDKMLDFMRQDLGLYMSTDELKLCRENYRTSKQKDITLSELYLLDEIIRLSANEPSNHILTDVITDDGDIIDTYNDLLSKQAVLIGSVAPPLTLGAAAKISSKYMKRIGADAKDIMMLNAFKTPDGFDLSSLISEKSQIKEDLPVNTAFVILTPTEADITEPEYRIKLEKLSHNSFFSEKILCARFVGKAGIAVTLANLCEGIYADIYSIPEMPEVRELSHLATECHGRLILALSKDNIPELSFIASNLGLCATYFAKAIALDKFMLMQKKNASMLINTSLIRRLGDMKHRSTARIIRENTDYAMTRSDIFLSDIPVKYGDTPHNKNRFLSLYSSAINKRNFLSAVYAFVDSLLPLIACGAEREDISVKTKYEFPNETSDVALGECLSTILGIYRATCELCIADRPLVQSSSNREVSLTCVAYADIDTPIQKTFSSSHSGVYFLSFGNSSDSLPSFDGIREMFNYVASLKKKEIIKSARAVSGKLFDTTRLMEKNSLVLSFAPNASFPTENVRGLILEVSAPIDKGIFLGTVEERVENDNFDIQ